MTSGSQRAIYSYGAVVTLRSVSSAVEKELGVCHCCEYSYASDCHNTSRSETRKKSRLRCMKAKTRNLNLQFLRLRFSHEGSKLPLTVMRYTGVTTANNRIDLGRLKSELRAGAESADTCQFNVTPTNCASDFGSYFVLHSEKSYRQNAILEWGIRRPALRAGRVFLVGWNSISQCSCFP